MPHAAQRFGRLALGRGAERTAGIATTNPTHSTCLSVLYPTRDEFCRSWLHSGRSVFSGVGDR
jgi:hypothetical protein